MKFPRKLYRTAEGHYCEEDDPASAFVVGPKGMEMNDLEAERLGISGYFAATEAKMIRQGAYEDKAEAAPPPTADVPAGIAPGVEIPLRTGRARS